MQETNWLPLIEYSNKHSVSISTLRRRIKENTINFRLEDGKYYIVDDSIEKASKGRKPIQIRVTSDAAHVATGSVGQQVMEELKKAYAATLHSKEELIFQLKEEVVDLKTLTKILEEELERVKATISNQY